MIRSGSRRFAAVVAVATLMTATAGAAAAPPARAWQYITGTHRGRDAAEKSAARFSQAGVRTRAGDLRVLEGAGGDVLVLPTSVKVESVIRRDVVDRDRLLTELNAAITVGAGAADAAEAAALDGQLASTEGVVAAVPYWSEKSRGCFSWLRRGGSYMAPCYYINKLINDGDGARDYFSLRQKATIGVDQFPWTIYDGWVQSVRAAGTSAQTWYDWDPGGTISGGCSSTSVSVSVKLVEIGIGATRCERWEPTLWQDAGHFRNKWNCDCFFGVGDARQVASAIAVSVGQGKSPVWTLSAGFRS
jgi:hypothetical protein